MLMAAISLILVYSGEYRTKFPVKNAPHVSSFYDLISL